MFTVEVRVGRLLEARIEALRTLERAAAYVDAFSAALQRSRPGTPLILCADHRAVAIYPQPVADKLASLFGMMNTRLARIALLVSPTNATLSMQLGRIVREANNPDRRVFLVPTEAAAFLGEVLTSAERTRLARFLRIDRSDVPPSSRSRS
jgi:hypothetical protein